MVRTLANAIDSGRLAHAFILTGVRGVGKTTTARIIARALNCIGVDGSGGPTVAPCGQCDNCQAIAEDRHVDVLEMDAASRTGVDDIRELISGVRYRPVQARFKVYIIDEVHMLSRNAFNALLKTLEEPPEHVKFIFATTEIRKVPVTVLSRCQRFDLRRVDADKLIAHFKRIAAEESVAIDDEALALLARAAEGSVRDGLSLLDQAIAHGAGTVDAAAVRDMLGLADRAVVFDLFDALMKGDVKSALKILRGQYESGADPVVVLQDLLALTHWLTTLKLVPEAGQDATTSETERVRGRDMATHLSMPVLTKVWQMLLKGLGELRQAPAPLAAAEMVLLRIAYAAELPDPADLVRRLSGAAAPAAKPTETPPASPAEPPPLLQAVVGDGPPPDQPTPVSAKAPADFPDPQDFAAVVAMFGARRELQLQAHLVNDVHLVQFAPGRIALRPTADAPRNLVHDVQQKLSDWTGNRWVVSVSRETGEPTLGTARVEREQNLRDEAEAHPLVQQARAVFPGAEIRAVRRAGALDVPLEVDLPDEESEE
jgi:DNA polymerase-3 subunit gamma/tau